MIIRYKQDKYYLIQFLFWWYE